MSYGNGKDDIIDILTSYGPSQGSCLMFVLEWGVVRDVWGGDYECRRYVEWISIMENTTLSDRLTMMTGNES